MLKTIIITTLLMCSTAMAMVSGNPMPLQSERINPISLSGECSSVKIIEWKGNRSRNDVAIINDVCNRAVNGFPKFVKEMNGKAPKTSPTYSLSIIPDGTGYRELNDYQNRFINRPKFCSTDGRKCGPNEKPFKIIGYTNFNHKHIFLSNNVDSTFKSTLAHEMFHELSQESGLYATYNDPGMDERLADSFAKWLGY